MTVHATTVIAGLVPVIHYAGSCHPTLPRVINISMKCNQCERPALYIYNEDIALCLSCHKTAQDIQFRNAILNAAMLNQAEDQLESAMGMSLGNSRIPINALATSLKATQMPSHIVIQNSNVGMLNTGDLAKIEAVITITAGSDVEELGEQIRIVTQAIIDSNEMNAETKRDLGELIATLSEQVSGRRSKPIIKLILQGIEERVKPINSIWTLIERLQTLLNFAGIG